MDQVLHSLHSSNHVLQSILYRLFGGLLNGLGSTLFTQCKQCARKFIIQVIWRQVIEWIRFYIVWRALHSANNVLQCLLFRLFGGLLNGLGSTLFSITQGSSECKLHKHNLHTTNYKLHITQGANCTQHKLQTIH